MNKLYGIILAFILTIRISYAGNINAYLKNGSSLNEGDVLLLNDTCIFKLNHPKTGARYRWTFMIDKQDGDNYELEKQLDGESSFELCIDSAFYKNFYLGRELKRTILENDSSVYYTGNVYCYLDNDLQGKFPLRINILPSIPKFKDVKLVYHDFDFEYLSFKRDTLFLTINTSGANELHVYIGEPSHYGYYFYLILPFDLNINQKEHSLCLPYFEFEQCYMFVAINDNGSVISNDSLFIIDYIDDPEILEAIRATDVKSIQDESIDIYHTPQSDILQIRGELSSILECKIYDTNGKIVKSTIPLADTIDISDLPSGIYITICTMKSNKFVIKKILK